MAEFEAKTQLSGLAGSIRATITSDQFDLGGYTEQRAIDLITSSFSAPLTEPTKMIKLTFVVGGGKLVRSKYSDDLSKWMIAALRDVGYAEDRSAAETFDSQGTFKQQHDTGQNLKYIIVYPHVTCASLKGSEGAGGSDTSSVILDTSSPDYIVCACELSTFQDMVASKIVSYKQKKRLMQILQASADKFKDIEAKLIAGTLLDPAEQQLYDANSGADADKILWLQGEIKSMVDEGRLTSGEKSDLLQSIDANVASITKEVEEATAEAKPKKVEKLLAKKEASVARKAVVDKIAPIKHHLAQSDQIQKLYMRLFPLLQLEDKGRSMSLTLADLKTLEEKSDLEDAIRSLEGASTGWFQEQADFETMCRQEEKEARARFNAKSKGAGGGPKKTLGSSGAGKPAGSSKPSASSSGWATAPAKKGSSSGVSGGAVKKISGFAAAFAEDSD